MRREFGVEQFLDREVTPETHRWIVATNLLTVSVVAFMLLCIVYYFAIGHLRPLVHVF